MARGTTVLGTRGGSARLLQLLLTGVVALSSALTTTGLAPAVAQAASRTSHHIAYVNYDDSGFTGSGLGSGNIFATSILGGPAPADAANAAVGYNGMTFTPLTRNAISSGTLAAFDTLILFEECAIATDLTGAQHDGIKNYLNAGNKVLLFDADRCSNGGNGSAGAANYDWFLYPFVTSAPGPQGARSNLTVVENSSLTQGLASDPFNGDELGDANTATTSDPHWFAAAKTTNVLGNNGYFLAYARTTGPQSGLIIYCGADFWVTGSGPTKSRTDLFNNMLNQQYDPDNLPSTVPIAPAAPQSATPIPGAPTATPAPQAPTPGPQTSWIYGYVYRQGTTIPVSGAEVYLTDTPLAVGTDDNGYFQFAGLNLKSGYGGSATYGVAVVPPPGYSVVGSAGTCQPQPTLIGCQMAKPSNGHGALVIFHLSRSSPAIALTPAGNLPGSTVTVHGSGFAPGQAVTFSWNRSLRLDAAPTITAGDGTFATTVHVPNGPATSPTTYPIKTPGTYSISAADAEGNVASANLLVRCFMSMGDSKSCALPNSSGHILILVPGIVWQSNLPPLADCLPNDVCRTTYTVKAGLNPTSGPLSASLSSVSIRPSHEIPFSYSGDVGSGMFMNTQTYTVLDNHQSIAQSSGPLLNQDIIGVTQMFPGVKIDIVADSLGGVVAAYTLRTFSPSNVDRVIVTDSPVRGIDYSQWQFRLASQHADQLASLLQSPNQPVFDELSPSSPIIDAIQREGKDQRFFVVTNGDDALFPPQVAFAGGSPPPSRSWADCLGQPASTSLGHGAVYESPAATEVIASIVADSAMPATSIYQRLLTTPCPSSLDITATGLDGAMITDPLGNQTAISMGGNPDQPTRLSISNPTLGQYTITRSPLLTLSNTASGASIQATMVEAFQPYPGEAHYVPPFGPITIEIYLQLGRAPTVSVPLSTMQ